MGTRGDAISSWHHNSRRGGAGGNTKNGAIRGFWKGKVAPRTEKSVCCRVRFRNMMLLCVCCPFCLCLWSALTPEICPLSSSIFRELDKYLSKGLSHLFYELRKDKEGEHLDPFFSGTTNPRRNGKRRFLVQSSSDARGRSVKQLAGDRKNANADWWVNTHTRRRCAW